jgi:pyruvate dehydrogenase E2 component (dihydrolipoamide acetyltransferase)
MDSAEPPAAQVFLSPRAAKIPGAQQLQAQGIRGSGPGGRILEADAIHYLRTRPKLSFAARRMVQEEEYRVPGQGSGINNMVLTGDLTPPGKALSRFRQVVATRMRASLAESAQFTLNASADARSLLAARKTIKAKKGTPGFVDININDMVMHVVIQTLTSFPDLNAEFFDGKVTVHENVDIAFACDTPKGLLVPVIKKSQSLSLPNLARRLKQLAEQAQTGQVPPDELSGGSLTVSNLGAMGIEHFTPIINPPQVAILGVSRHTVRPVYIKEQIEPRTILPLSLSYDHRNIDGADAARFLRWICEGLEQPLTLFLE